MTSTRGQQHREALQRVCLGVLETCAAAGAGGVPAGVMFAAMQAQGATLNQFNSFMDTFMSEKFLTRANDCYAITSIGTEFMQTLQ